MEYAVIRTGGKQHKVKVGDVLEIDRITQDSKSLVFDDVLLFVSDGKASIGKPNVSGVSVKAKLLEEKKGEKIRVIKYKAKVRYRRTMGFRPIHTVIQIDSIDGKNKKTETKPAPKKAKA